MQLCTAYPYTTSSTTHLKDSQHKMTRNTRIRSPSISSSSDGSCYTASTSGCEASSGVGLEHMLASLHLDPTMPVLNAYKIRCQAAGVPVGKTKKECKQVRTSRL